jgi:hypothetical protein
MGREKGEKMKIVIEPEMLKHVMSQLLVQKGNSSAFESVSAVFDGEGMSVAQISNGILAIKANYAKEFFLEFEGSSEDTEVVAFTPSLLAGIGWGFNDKTIILKTTPTEIVIQGQKEHYKHKLSEPIVEPFPIKTEETDKGIIPSGKFKPKVCVELKKTEFASLPKSENYRFFVDKGKLKIEVRAKESEYEWSTILTPDRIEIMEECEIVLDGENLSKILNNVNETFWFMFDDAGSVFVNKGRNNTLTYVLLPLAE